MRTLEMKLGYLGELRFVRVDLDILFNDETQTHAQILERLRPGETDLIDRLQRGDLEGDMGFLTLLNSGMINIHGYSISLRFPGPDNNLQESRQKTKKLLETTYDGSKFVTLMF